MRGADDRAREAFAAVLREGSGEFPGWLKAAGLERTSPVSPTLKIKVADVSGRKLSPASAAPVDAIIADALARRPDMQGAFAAEKASLAKVSAAEAEFMPKVFVNAAGTYNEGNLNVTAIPSAGQNLPATLNISGPHWGGSVFAGVAMPVYDAGARAALLAQARSDAEAAAARLERIRQDAVRQIVLADNALHTSLAAYSASQALAAAAQTTFELGAELLPKRRGLGHGCEFGAESIAVGEERFGGRAQRSALRRGDARLRDRSSWPSAAIGSPSPLQE